MKKLLLPLVLLICISYQVNAQNNTWTSGIFSTYLDVNANRPINSASEGLNIGRNYNTNIQLATKTWSGNHVIFFNAYKSSSIVSGNLITPGNSKFANSTTSYGSGAGAISFYGNGGTLDFYISGVSTGENTNVIWGTPKLRIKRNGKVGIGIDPFARFHIAQQGGGWTDGIRLTLQSHSWDMVSDVNGERLLISRDQKTNNGIAIYNGNLGVGIGYPTEKLVVNGKILAEEIKVQTVPSSDYVFEPDYNLLPIQEVATFIQKNKHLPDIPSAEEFKENGVGLGEMDNILLRKVEELTLYVIELNAKNEKQDELIKQILKAKSHD